MILGRVELSRNNLNPRINTMTDDKIALRALLEKGSDATFLREMIGFAAERLMQLETEGICNAAPGERSADRRNQRNGYRDRDWETRAGTVELRIPKLRKGRSYEEPRQRAVLCQTVPVKPSMETGMSTSGQHSEGPSAVRVDLGAIFISLELSQSKWLITSLSPGRGEKLSQFSTMGGNVAGLLGRVAEL